MSAKKQDIEDKHWLRNTKKKYVAIEKRIKHSPAYSSLSPLARCLLLEFHEICFPYYRNGDLSIKSTTAAKSLGVTRGTVRKAYNELQAKGFIVLTGKAAWRAGLTAVYRLTTRPTRTGRSSELKEPTNEWLDWKTSKDDLPIKNPGVKKRASFKKDVQKLSNSKTLNHPHCGINP